MMCLRLNISVFLVLFPSTDIIIHFFFFLFKALLQPYFKFGGGKSFNIEYRLFWETPALENDYL